MASRHALALDVLDTTTPTVLRLSDASVYADGLGVDCPQLEVTLPGGLQPVYATAGLFQGFVRTLTAKDLGLQRTADTSPALALPDGVYTLCYAVSPHDQTRVCYYHLRQVQALRLYAEQLCRVHLATCLPDKEQLEKLKKLRLIHNYLQAAKAQVEVCHSPEKGQQLFAYALLLLRKFTTHPCPTCRP